MTELLDQIVKINVQLVALETSVKRTVVNAARVKRVLLGPNAIDVQLDTLAKVVIVNVHLFVDSVYVIERTEPALTAAIIHVLLEVGVLTVSRANMALTAIKNVRKTVRIKNVKDITAHALTVANQVSTLEGIVKSASPTGMDLRVHLSVEVIAGTPYATELLEHVSLVVPLTFQERRA